MNLSSKPNIKNLLQQYNLWPSKQLGQNFLINQKALQKIIQTADLSKKDTVLEIGPGLGTLTQELAKRAKKVIAVEKDKKMVEALKEILGDYKNIEIIHGDILKLKSSILNSQFSIPYKLVANIPYYLTSPLIRLLLESEKPPQEITLLVQKEVAQRICAKPPKMNLLAVSVQFYSSPKIISYISKGSFWPRPKVDSAIIKITPHVPVIAKRPKTNEAISRFFKVVKAGFSSPRKQLANNLSQKLNLPRQEIKKALTKCHLDTRVRAENLKINDWKTITRLLT